MLRLNPQSRKKPSPAAGSPLYAPAVTVPPRAKSQICVPVTEGFSSENDDRPTLPFKQLYAPQRSIHNSAWVDTQSEWNRTEPLVCTNTQRGWYSACLCRGGGLFWLVASKCLLYLFICIQHNQCKRFFGRVEYKSKLVMIDDYPLSLPHFPFTCSYALFQFVHMETWVGTKKKKKKSWNIKRYYAWLKLDVITNTNTIFPSCFPHCFHSFKVWLAQFLIGILNRIGLEN